MINRVDFPLTLIYGCVLCVYALLCAASHRKYTVYDNLSAKHQSNMRLPLRHTSSVCWTHGVGVVLVYEPTTLHLTDISRRSLHLGEEKANEVKTGRLTSQAL